MNRSNAGHPKGLYMLCVTEMWERFSFYGMRAIFVLYMSQALLFNKELASQIYGNYTGLIYLSPLLGGYIADRFWGNRKSIIWGALIMAVGQMLMFLSACYYTQTSLANWLMMAGLGVLIAGNGLFKPNISTMVGSLYEESDRRKDAAFTIFYMGINAGAMVAPLVCGFLGNTGNPEDFKWGFLAAAVGMVIGTLRFVRLKERYLVTPTGEAIGMAPITAEKKDSSQSSPKGTLITPRIVGAAISFIALLALFSINYGSFTSPEIGLFSGADFIGALIYACMIVVPIFLIFDSSLSKIEQRRILVIYIIAFFVIFFWAAFEQAGASLTFFADEQTNRNLFGWEMPASYFQSFNAIFIVLLAPLFASMWSKMGERGIEPSSPTKQALGLFLLSMGYLIISLGVSGVEGDTRVSMLWLIGLYFIHTLGELCLSPIGLSMVNQLSPARFASLLMGVWYLSLSAANKFSGILSGYYPEDGVVKSFWGYEIATLSDFFMVFVVMSGVAAIILFLLSSQLKKMME